MCMKDFGVGLWLGLLLLSTAGAGIAAGGDARLADAVMHADRDAIRSRHGSVYGNGAR